MSRKSNPSRVPRELTHPKLDLWLCVFSDGDFFCAAVFAQGNTSLHRTLNEI